MALKEKIYERVPWGAADEKAAEVFSRMVEKDKEELPADFHLRVINSYEKARDLPTYKLLQRMPKGCLHHLHFDCNESLEFTDRLIDHPHTYIDVPARAWRVASEEAAKEHGYVRARSLRGNFPSDEAFLAHIRNLTRLSLAEIDDRSKNIWRQFETKILAFSNISYSQEVSYEYILHSFAKLQEEGFIRVEPRVLVFPVGDRLGHFDDEKAFVDQFRKAEEELQKRGPFSVGVIAQGLKMWDDATVKKYFKTCEATKHPNLVGIDMVQEEEFYPEICERMELYAEIAKESKLPFVLHGGETNNPKNTNLAALLALGTKRIGHGFNLRQHAYLMPEIKARQICLEVNPVSNQVLRYISDLRYHPAIAFHHYGIPISISPDDPARFWVEGATYDWFVVALEFGFTLRDLKLVALNSIWHSLSPASTVQEMQKVFLGQWDKFAEGLSSQA